MKEEQKKSVCTPFCLLLKPASELSAVHRTTHLCFANERPFKPNHYRLNHYHRCCSSSSHEDSVLACEDHHWSAISVSTNHFYQVVSLVSVQHKTQGKFIAVGQQTSDHTGTSQNKLGK